MGNGDGTSDEVIVRREGRLGRLTLNRPQALNALTWRMVKTISAALAAWEGDPAVAAVLLDGAGDRGLCAGGDVRWLYDQRVHGPEGARGFWRDEYTLNARIAAYPKPFVAIMDGIVMGGGIGLSAHARHRVVTERSQLAMPETTIGLIPDVGGTFLLARAQGRLGVYLGLVGARMSGSDAIQAGFADTYITAGRLRGLTASLATGTDPVEDVLEAASEPVPESALAAQRPLIDRLFAGETLGDIQAALLTTPDPLAQKSLADLKTRSPRALALTLEAIRRARGYRSLEEALAVEFRLCTRLYDDGEFIEGVRALIVDKDKSPKWRPPTIAEVTPDMVASAFAPGGAEWR